MAVVDLGGLGGLPLNILFLFNKQTTEWDGWDHNLV